MAIFQKRLPHNGGVTGRYFADETLAGAKNGDAVVLCPDAMATATGKPGDNENRVCLPSGSDGVFIGFLFDDVDDWDRTKCCYPNHRYRNATTTCRPVNIIDDMDFGCFDEQHIDDNANPMAGLPVFAGPDGLTEDAALGVPTPYVFAGVRDSSGRVAIRKA